MKDRSLAEWNQSTVDPGKSGKEMHELIRKLYPICRSITGDGVRQTLKILQEYVPLSIHEVPTGARVFDWTIPMEWNIRSAYVRDPRGRKIIDFQKSNLHVLNYSVPVQSKVTLEELKAHLYTIPEHPDWIPYRTSYYKENWGFCISHNQLLGLTDGEYEVFIDSSLKNGSLTYGEYLVKGQTDDEILISTHVCHPSLANDNLAGIAIATFLARYLRPLSTRYSYRFLFTPGGIGSITWLSQNEQQTSRIKHGLVLACLGDSGNITYKKTRLGDAEVDRVVMRALQEKGDPHSILDFTPYGYDERQFGSPGFNLPVGCLMRTPHGEFEEYHTSADNLDFVKPEHLSHSFSFCRRVFEILEQNRTYWNTNPKCEPQLGRRGLYSAIGGNADGRLHELALLWVLNLSDGAHSLLDIASQSALSFEKIEKAAEALRKQGLLREQLRSFHG